MPLRDCRRRIAAPGGGDVTGLGSGAFQEVTRAGFPNPSAASFAGEIAAEAAYNACVQASTFDEEELFAAIIASGARALLIGRRALVALGIPVLTADYDLWIHAEDAAALNTAVAALDLFPNRSPDEARKVGRYVLEGDERVDVLVARRASTKDGTVLQFDDAWERRRAVRYSDRVSIFLPSLEDLILTKRWSLRPKDVDDIELLQKLKHIAGSDA